MFLSEVSFCVVFVSAAGVLSVGSVVGSAVSAASAVFCVFVPCCFPLVCFPLLLFGLGLGRIKLLIRHVNELKRIEVRLSRLACSYATLTVCNPALFPFAKNFPSFVSFFATFFCLSPILLCFP